jgi:hypothetical protein
MLTSAWPQDPPAFLSASVKWAYRLVDADHGHVVARAVAAGSTAKGDSGVLAP